MRLVGRDVIIAVAREPICILSCVVLNCRLSVYASSLIWYFLRDSINNVLIFLQAFQQFVQVA